MADENSSAATEERTYTQEEFEAMVAERDALKANRDEILTEAKKAKDRLRAFDGVDPEEHKRLKQQLLDAETQAKAKKEGITSEALEKLRREVREALESEYAPFKSKADELARENRSLKLDNVVKAEMAKQGVRADRIDALYRLEADAFDLTDDGKPILKDRAGFPIDKYINEEVLKKFPEFFEGTGSSGGGASKPNAGGSRGPTRAINATDNDAFISNLEGIAKGQVEVRQ